MVRTRLSGTWLASALLGAALVLSGCGTPAQDTQDTRDAPVADRTASDSAAPRPKAKQTAQPSADPTTSDEDGVLVPDGLKTGAPGDDLGSTRGRRIFGADYSWPQCPPGMGIKHKRTLGAPMPTAAARFVIIGLTNGPSFTPNPCLADQVAWARERRLLAAAYAVVSFPDQRQVDQFGADGPFGTSRLDQLRNVGFQAARYTIDRMRRAGLPSPIVWVDVETVNHYDWEGTTAEHAAVVQGTVRGYTDAGLRVGFYSTPAIWNGIVGDLSFGDLPEWRAAGQTSMAEALSRCGRDWSIQGGPGVFGQWVEDGRDRNVTCPGVDLRLADYFHRF